MAQDDLPALLLAGLNGKNLDHRRISRINYRIFAARFPAAAEKFAGKSLMLLYFWLLDCLNVCAGRYSKSIKTWPMLTDPAEIAKDNEVQPHDVGLVTVSIVIA